MARKDYHDEQLRIGLDRLVAAGVSVDSPTAEMIPKLRDVIGTSAPMDLAATFLLGKIAATASLELLELVEKSTTDKEVKKEVKRAYFKLAQKGITIAKEEAVQKKTVPLFESTPEIEAYMSAVDGGGGRLVWIAKPQPNRGLQVIQSMLHEREGILRFGGAHMKRKELRAMADEIKRQHGVTMISIPWEYADRMIYEGYENAKARGRSGLENFHQVRSLISAVKPAAVSHPVYQRLGTAEPREIGWREQSRRLLDEPELRYWVLIDDWVKEFLGQIQEAQSSRLVLNAVQKEERLAAIVRDAVKALCSGDNGVTFKRRMEDTALYFCETQRPDRAKLALAVALQVGEGDPGPLDVSFLTGLMQKSFAFLMAQEKARKEEEQSSLIVKP